MISAELFWAVILVCVKGGANANRQLRPELNRPRFHTSTPVCLPNVNRQFRLYKTAGLIRDHIICKKKRPVVNSGPPLYVVRSVLQKKKNPPSY